MWKNGVNIKNVSIPTGNIYSASNPYNATIGYLPDGAEYSNYKLAKFAVWRKPLSDVAISRITADLAEQVGVII